MFCANYIDQSNRDPYSTIWFLGSFDLEIWVDYMTDVTKHNNKTTFIFFKIMHCVLNALSDWSKSWRSVQMQCLSKVHLNTIGNGDLSDTQDYSVTRGLTIVRLHFLYKRKLYLRTKSVKKSFTPLILCHLILFRSLLSNLILNQKHLWTFSNLK